ncbi:hypothetical protein [Cardinium endosymbiont of Culicoides punctatus]|uniref:hypothetical protein n=1 Tax=Cardinium endosymbiont of Culicoides punctatus TaxID=2304601 RepID=UPI001058912C|nr:hypothetical protein [Cardinium endosymbiont of Culicoides punctatus]TDG95694.1 hypothetical protein CCPUN_01570 [Cardinium endosymbiont of Culicoides punctatus]
MSVLRTLSLSIGCMLAGCSQQHHGDTHMNNGDTSETDFSNKEIVEENAKVKSDMSELIASAAEQYIGSRGWGYKSKKGSFGSGTFKNHLFVAKVIAAAGEASSSPDVVSQFLKDPLLAREWGSNVEIPNWEIVDRPQRGDVVAIGYKNKSMDEMGRRYSGEVGIVVNVGIVVSGNFGEFVSVSSTSNRVERASLPIGSDNPHIFRRYVGPPCDLITSLKKLRRTCSIRKEAFEEIV